MPLNIRRVGPVLFGIALVLAIPIGGAGAQAHPAAVKIQSPVHLTPLSKAQLQQLKDQQQAPRAVIVIMRNQFENLAGHAKHNLATRATAIAQAERPVVRQLAQVHAAQVRAFSIINAVSATVKPAEVRYLQSQPSVLGVVADKQIRLPTLPNDGYVARKAKPAAVRHITGRDCSTTQPLLEPEALGLTNDAFASRKTPQAQDEANGAGVNVAFMADGFDYLNPDFIRPDGNLVYTDAEDFSGSAALGAMGNDEASIDASSIAAQGNDIYNVNNYVNALSPAKNPKACQMIRIVGMAPGANLVGLQVFGPNGIASTSDFVEAIGYAVASGVNVLNQSFGSNPYPDENLDPISLADEAAIADGVVVVASSGDSGTNSSNGSPSTVPGVIAVGATTQLQAYKQVGEQGFQLGNGKYLDNNISGFSSGGPAQSGLKSVDLVAPGDLSWMVCDPSACSDNNGLPTPFWLSGGTSESAPLTAGAAALVIQKYRGTHNGTTPSPAIVKSILMSSATNLDLPSSEQGAGLLNALGAVRMAAGWNLPVAKHQGDRLAVNANGCWTAAYSQCNMALSSTNDPGASNTFTIGVTNEGRHKETVTPDATKLEQFAGATNNTNLTPATDPSFINSTGGARPYQSVYFTVPAHTDVLSVTAAYDISARPGSILYEILFAPGGTYAGYDQPQGAGNGFDREEFHNPAPGKWRLVLATRPASSSEAYIGNVQWTWTASKFVTAGTVSPSSAKVSAGASKTFTVKMNTPASSGDGIAQVAINGDIKHGPATTMTVPVILRSKIPTTAAGGGTWTGTFTGGNGRPGSANEQTFQFAVPAGQNDLSVGVAMKDATTNIDLGGYLVGPDGVPVDYQDNITSTSFSPDLQLFRRAPAAGLWTLTLIVDYYSGPTTSEPYTGTIAFNAVNVQSSGIPDSGSTVVSPSSPAQGTITIKNTGDSVEYYYVDPRLDTTTTYGFLNTSNSSPAPIAGAYAFIPPESSEAGFVATGSDATTPVNLEAVYDGGSGPAGYSGEPDGLYLSSTNMATLTYSAAEVPQGAWVVQGDDLSCPCNAPAENETFTLQAAATTQTFDGDVTTSTGDIWTGPTTALGLNPGQSGQVTVSITPSETSGTALSGNLYVDTVSVKSGSVSNNYVSDEVAAIPYSYTVGP